MYGFRAAAMGAPSGARRSGGGISGLMGSALSLGTGGLGGLGLSLAGGLIKSLFGRGAAKRKAKDERNVALYRQKQAGKNRDIGMGWLALLENANRRTRAQQGRAPAPSFFGDDFSARFAPGGQLDMTDFDPAEIPVTSTPGFWSSALGGIAGGAMDYFGDREAAESDAMGQIGMSPGQPVGRRRY